MCSAKPFVTHANSSCNNFCFMDSKDHSALSILIICQYDGFVMHFLT